MRSRPSASRLLHCSNVFGVRYWLVSLESIQIGMSVGVVPFGNRYSSKLHFGISSAGKGEEKGIVVVEMGSLVYQGRNSNNDHE